MKKTLFAICVLVYLLLAACSDDIVDKSQPIDPQSRGIIDYENKSTSNPNLISDWENQMTITLNAPSLGKSAVVQTPWSNSSSGLLPEKFRKDIKKEKGWTMLFHTFSNVGDEADMNYMVFYNYFTGYMKFFYYLDSEIGGSALLWQLQSGTTSFALLDNPSLINEPMDVPGTNQNKFLIFSNATTNGMPCRGWNGFEFHIARYANDLSSEDLSVSAVDVIDFQINTEGFNRSDITGTITSVTTSNKHEFEHTVCNIAGEGVEKLVKKYILGISDNKGFDIKNIISKISGKDYGAAIFAGLNFFTGNSMQTTLYTVSDVQLSSVGTFQSVGTVKIERMSAIKSLNFNLREILDSRQMRAVVTPVIPPYIITPTATTEFVRLSPLSNLGVWNVTTQPIAYFESIGEFHPIEISKTPGGTLLEMAGMADYPIITRGYADITFNPYVKQYLKDYSVKVEFMDVVDSSKPTANDIDSTVYQKSPRHILNPALYLYPNQRNKIFTNNSFSYYTIGGLQGFQNPFGDLNYESEVNEDTKYYVEWESVVPDGSLTAFVTVDMVFDYNGNEIKVIETRPYRAHCLIDPTSNAAHYHNPPIAYVVNRLKR